MEDELLDLVNQADEVIGTIWRSQAQAEKKIGSVRAVWFLLQNEAGQLGIPRRVAHKKSDPLFLDGSAVGQVRSGETYEQAMIREVHEELHLRVTDLPYSLVGRLTPTTGAQSFIQIFQATVPHDFQPDYNRDDFSEILWVYPHELLEKHEQGEKIRPTLLSIVAKFYR